jgi:putative ABC transport system permease protein
MVSALLANVLDRVRELGVLRALGMLRAQVQRLVIIESTFVGLIGTLAGVAMGIALGYILLRHIATVQIGWYLPYRLPASAIAQLCLVTIPLAALAGFYPARKAAQLVVSDALDYE